MIKDERKDKELINKGTEKIAIEGRGRATICTENERKEKKINIYRKRIEN